MASADISTVPGLGDVASWATDEEQGLVRVLLEAGQEHLFAGWKQNADLERKRQFFAQVRDGVRKCILRM
jgi:hypothetical protein